MDTGKLKKFAQKARQDLIQQVSGKLTQVLDEGSAARREQPRAVADLEKQIEAHGRQEVIERAAYTWFNRFTALRYMDAHRYNRIMAVSPGEGQSQPEILAEAKQGHIDERIVPDKLRERVMNLLDQRTPSRDYQGEAYRLLLVAVCNYWHQAMPFMFERIADWTELLMPDDLLSDTSVRTRIRTVLSAEDCQDVEVIGWLYQFYISEKKDEVFAALKKGKKITAENIPAATQLFTPHWIVRYLVENSLGRLWLLNRPNSRLAERMDYYIAPEEPETDFLKISKPEEIKLCDPACGSGHMLTYAFDLLYAIYEEEGYAPDDIPALILEHNLTGIEIDERAGALAAFALAMKAAEKLGRRKFLKLAVQPNIVVLQNVRFSEQELKDYMTEVGRDLFTADLKETLGQFEQAKNFGSLIRPALKDTAEVQRMLDMQNFEGKLFLSGTHQRVRKALRMAAVLSRKYSVVVANPPYMGGTGMNMELSSYAHKAFPEGKADLMTCFMVRVGVLTASSGIWAMINIPTWMFLSTFENLRVRLLKNQRILSLVHAGRGLFGPDFGAVAFVIENKRNIGNKKSTYRRLFQKQVDVRTPEAICDLFLDEHYGRHLASESDFLSIPGSPIAYWISNELRDIFSNAPKLGSLIKAKQGLSTSDNPRFIRQWWEVSTIKRGATGLHSIDYEGGLLHWAPYNKGGEFRKWYGNLEHIIWWKNGGEAIAALRPKSVMRSPNFYFRQCVSWLSYTVSKNSFRSYSSGFVFDTSAHSGFSESQDDLMHGLCLSNSKPFQKIAAVINPTVHFHSRNFMDVPVARAPRNQTNHISNNAVDIAKADWDAYEISWDFSTLHLISSDHRAETLRTTFDSLRDHWQNMTDEMQRLEEENNRIFIEAYGLQDELTPEVPIDEITLTCNPAYRYGIKISEEEREKRLLADTMAEFLSYAVGCMFGRYSLDKPGLVLSNQGETLADYLAQVPEPTFMPDDDNIIPILDDTWFTDDIVERFHEFLRVTFGEEHFQENLTFIEEAIGKPVRKYFLKDFYKDHVKRYKKRPIYWLFSSPKGSFNALIYMHRYRPDTVSVMLNDYLREFRTKLGARVQQLEEIEASTSASTRDKTAALKEMSKLRANIAELEDWERKVMLPLASEKIEIDLDDGVKANYPKFGSALAKVPGLSK